MSAESGETDSFAALAEALFAQSTTTTNNYYSGQGPTLGAAREQMEEL